MKNVAIFGLFFVLGIVVLTGGAFLVTDWMRTKDQAAVAQADIAYIDASSLEPASGAATPDPAPAATEGTPKDSLMPAVTPEGASAVADVETTHPLLRVTPDKTEMVTLDRDAQSVVVGNPAHASVLMENPKLLLVVPRSAGATHMTVLDKNGDIIMQRHIVVSAPREKYVRIRRSCSNATGRNAAGCEPISVYYCPDMCHEVSQDAADRRR